jgi:hypothetical protein
MTISELIHGKLRKAKIIGFLFWLAFAATIFMPGEGNMFFVSFIPFAGFGGTILYAMYSVKCPRCSASLGHVSMSLRSPFSRKVKLNYCPNCGVSLDETV